MSNKKGCNFTSFQRVDKPIDTLETSKREVIFCQFEFVGVRWYVRVQIGKKQVTARKTRCFPCGLIYYNIYLNINIV